MQLLKIRSDSASMNTQLDTDERVMEFERIGSAEAT